MNASEVNSIIAENAVHNSKLFSPYSPYTGEGSPIDRFAIYLNPNSYILIPEYTRYQPFVQALLQYDSVDELCATQGLDYQTFIDELNTWRVKWDFEFWAATCGTIYNKRSRKEVKFVLRHPQLKLLKILVEDFFAEIPVRIILLKARQWGGSTLVQLFMSWVQIFHKENWNSTIIALQKDQAYNILNMYDLMAKRHPKEIYDVQLKSFQRSATHRQLKGRGNIIYLGSMERPDSLRSADISMAHLSEVGLWKETDGKKPEDIIQSIEGTIAEAPYTIIVKESTAKGVGNYFHHSWQDAVQGNSNDKPVFVAWWEIEDYYRPFRNEREMKIFVESMTQDELYYFSLGATLEGLNWYRRKLRSMHGDTWRMRSEFPATADEAFQSTGRPAHSPLYIQQMEPFTKAPLYRGEIFADALDGPECLKNIHFCDTPEGNFWVWALPDKSRRIENRYVVSLDIGGRSDEADWSVISVVDRLPLMNGGIEECIATYRFHLDQDLTIWRAVQVAKFYNEALFVPESNSLDEKGQEGDHSLTILDTIKPHYPPIFSRTNPQKVREGLPALLGFHTNRASKTDLVTQMNKRFRDVLHIEYDARALYEARVYEIKKDGSYGAVDGEHDDIYMSRAIALKASDLMPLPVEITYEVTPQRANDTVRSESSF